MNNKEIKTFEDAQKANLYCHKYPNSDWMYQDKDGFVHLFRDNKDLTKELHAVYCMSCDGGTWGYEDLKGNTHIFLGEEQIEKIKINDWGLTIDYKDNEEDKFVRNFDNT